MIDRHTQKTIRVNIHENSAPSIIVSQDDMDKVRTLLEVNNVPHWVRHQAISHNGKPPVMKIILRQRANPQIVQELLDKTA